MNQDLEDAPIACTLPVGSLKDRKGWIAELNASALKASRRRDLQLELDYDSAHIADVRLMVEQEESCCGFLKFEVRETRALVTVTIEVPEAGRELADSVFATFKTKGEQKPGGSQADGLCRQSR